MKKNLFFLPKLLITATVIFFISFKAYSDDIDTLLEQIKNLQNVFCNFDFHFFCELFCKFCFCKKGNFTIGTPKGNVASPRSQLLQKHGLIRSATSSATYFYKRYFYE